MRLSMSSFVKSHKLIWPGVEVPEVQTGIRGPIAGTTQVQFLVSAVTTSLLVSIIHCMISRIKRTDARYLWWDVTPLSFDVWATIVRLGLVVMLS